MLRQFIERRAFPLADAGGQGALPYDHPLNLGAIGVTGTLGANQVARDADLVIGIGTRYSDFTTASKTQFQHPHVRFININAAEFDAYKHSAIPLVGDARATLEELLPLLEGWQVAAEYRAQAAQTTASGTPRWSASTRWSTAADRRRGPAWSTARARRTVFARRAACSVTCTLWCTCDRRRHPVRLLHGLRDRRGMGPSSPRRAQSTSWSATGRTR